MTESKEVTTQDIRKEMLGLDPITKKNLLSYTQGKPASVTLDFIKHYKKVRGLDTSSGMAKYNEDRKNGCKGCKNKR